MEKKLEVFEEGQLCYVVRRPWKGEGEPVLILHEAVPIADLDRASFFYGHGRTWVVPSEVELYIEPVDHTDGEKLENGCED